MAAETSTVLGTNVFVDIPGQRQLRELKKIIVQTPNASTGDTFTVNLALYGGTSLVGVSGCKHTTNDSVVVSTGVNPTTTVSGTTVTLTVVNSTTNKQVVELLFV